MRPRGDPSWRSPLGSSGLADRARAGLPVPDAVGSGAHQVARVTRSSAIVSPGAARRDHTDHILRNQFREELGLSADPRVDPESNTTTASVSEASVEVDGEERPAMQIDTDPLVYSIGFPIDEQVTCTAVIPRDALALVDLAFTRFSARPQTPARTDSSDG